MTGSFPTSIRARLFFMAMERSFCTSSNISWQSTLASFFFRNPGRLLTRRELFREIWGINTPIESRTVDVHVSRIRRSLDIAPRNGYRIKTVYQHGYRLEKADD